MGLESLKTALTESRREESSSRDRIPKARIKKSGGLKTENKGFNSHETEILKSIKNKDSDG